VRLVLQEALFFTSRIMHGTCVPQVALLELLDALEAKIAAMWPRNAAAARPLVVSEVNATHWNTSWASRNNGRLRPKPIHPFLNIEEL
jgi:hypothetical protein